MGIVSCIGRRMKWGDGCKTVQGYLSPDNNCYVWTIILQSSSCIFLFFFFFFFIKCGHFLQLFSKWLISLESSQGPESSLSFLRTRHDALQRVSHLLGSSSDIPINMATGHWIMLYLYLILMTGPSFLSAALQQLSLQGICATCFWTSAQICQELWRVWNFTLFASARLPRHKDADPRCEPSRQGV